MRLAVALHLFDLTLINEFKTYLSNITQAGHSYDLYISVLQGSNYSLVKTQWPTAIIIERENRGFDIASFLELLPTLFTQRYDYVLKLHSKSNVEWRRQLLDPIIGTPQRVNHCLNLLSSPTVGLVGAEKWSIKVDNDLGVNSAHMHELSTQLGLVVTPFTFIGGTIFWIKLSILQKALSTANLYKAASELSSLEDLDSHWYRTTYPQLNIVTTEDAEKHWHEKGRLEGRACNCLYARVNGVRQTQCDGMREHAWERLWGLMVTAHKQRVIAIPQKLKIEAIALVDNTQIVKPALYKQLGASGTCYWITTSQSLPTDTHKPFCLGWDPRTPIALELVAQLLMSPHYLKVDGRPLLYLPGVLSEPEGFALLTKVANTPTEEDYNHVLRKSLLSERTEYLLLKSVNQWSRSEIQAHQLLQTRLQK